MTAQEKIDQYIPAEYQKVIKRAAYTFVQTFFATWIVSGLNLEKGTIVAALAAGLSAAMNIPNALKTAQKN